MLFFPVSEICLIIQALGSLIYRLELSNKNKFEMHLLSEVEIHCDRLQITVYFLFSEMHWTKFKIV